MEDNIAMEWTGINRNVLSNLAKSRRSFLDYVISSLSKRWYLQNHSFQMKAKLARG